MQGKKFPWPLSRGGGGGAKGLSGRATKKITFLAASLSTFKKKKCLLPCDFRNTACFTENSMAMSSWTAETLHAGMRTISKTKLICYF